MWLIVLAVMQRALLAKGSINHPFPAFLQGINVIAPDSKRNSAALQSVSSYSLHEQFMRVVTGWLASVWLMVVKEMQKSGLLEPGTKVAIG